MTQENSIATALDTFPVSVGVAFGAGVTFHTPGPGHFIKPPCLHT